jgi:hypothetical protein
MGPPPAAAVTSAVSSTIAHRSSRVPWARATRPARAQAVAVPSAQWSAAASAARSAPPAARCRTTTAWPRVSTPPNTTHRTATAPTLQTVADPRSENRAETRRKNTGHFVGETRPGNATRLRTQAQRGNATRFGTKTQRGNETHFGTKSCLGTQTPLGDRALRGNMTRPKVRTGNQRLMGSVGVAQRVMGSSPRLPGRP